MKRQKHVLLLLINIYTEPGRPVNSSSGSNYAPTIFVSDQKPEVISGPKFTIVMKFMFHKKVISSE